MARYKLNFKQGDNITWHDIDVGNPMLPLPSAGG